MPELKLHHEIVKKSNLGNKVRSFLNDFDGYCIIESEDENFIIFTDKIESKHFEKLINANVFNDKKFLKIEKIHDDSYNVITDLIIGKTSIPYHIESKTDREIYVWGEHLEKNMFFENVTPKIIEYPVMKKTTAKRLKLTVKEYYDEYGNAVFYRFINLVEVSNG